MDSLILSIVQVLKTKVLQCDPDKAKMLLSFKATVEGDAADAAVPQFDCEVGKVSLTRYSPGLLVSLSQFGQILPSTCICVM